MKHKKDMMPSRRNCYTYRCLRAFLVAFNFLFLVFGLLLATLPVYFTINKMLKSWPINGGIIGMGTLLILIAVIGCYGSTKQHQIVLFFYIVLLTLVFLMTLALSLAALSLSKAQQESVLSHGWEKLSNQTRGDIQNLANCCGFSKELNERFPHPYCEDSLRNCLSVVEEDWFISFRRAIGGVALFVALLMCISIYFTYKYRHMKNPKSNPNAYL